MEENTLSLNNNQNYDIYSFHKESEDKRLCLLVSSIQNQTLLSGAHPGSELKVNFHHMAVDTLPLVFHTKRNGRLIYTREEADAVRVRVLQMVTPKMSWQRRILSRTWGRECVLSELSLGAGGWGKTCREAECQKFHTHLETQAPVCGSHQSKTQSLLNSTVYTSWTWLWSKNGLKYTKRNSMHEMTYFY